jgi:TP901 family phage tail tape measure protein
MYALRGTSDTFIRAGRGMLVAGGIIAYGFTKAVGAAAEFERKMDYFGAVTDTNSKKMQKLSKFTLQVAQDTIYSANEIADGFVELGKAGVNADQIMRGVGRAMAYLGAAADIPLPEAAQIITSAVAQFELGGKEAIHVADLLAGAANASIADVTDIGYALKYVGGIAHTAGLGLDDVTTAISVLAKAGIRGSTAGTTLRQMIVSLPGTTDKAQAALKDLGIITEDGSNKFYDLHGNIKPLSQVFQILQNSMKGLTKEQQTTTLRTIFQTRALSAASVLMRAGSKGFKNMMGEMSKVTAMEVANKRLDNLSGDIEILKGNIETLVIQQGGPFQETLRGWVQKLTQLVQAFSKLDPQTQKFISQAVLMTGAGLILMGTLNLIIGIILKFIYNMIRMGESIKFVAGFLRNMWTWVRLLSSVFVDSLIAALTAVAAALGITVGALVAILAAIAAVVAGVVILYKKWQPFHDLVNMVAGALWNAAKAVAGFFKRLITDPGKVWKDLKKGFNSLVGWVRNLGGQISKGFQTALSAVGNFISKVVHWFISLPGRVWGAITSFMAKLKTIFTMKNIAYAIGYAIGVMVRLFLTFAIKVGLIVADLITKVVGFFRALPGKIAGFIVNMAARVSKSFSRMKQKAINFTVKMVTGVVRQVRALPGKIAGFFAAMVGRALAWAIKFATSIPGKVKQAKDNIVNFVKDLPAKVGAKILEMYNKAKHWVQKLPMMFFNAGIDLYEKFRTSIENLPSLVGGIMDNLIGAIKDKITGAFNAVKDFASNMWDGFKAGLHINSPSIIEKKMWEITGVMDTEVKKMKKKTLDVQHMSKQLAKTSFTVGDPGALPSASGYRKLAVMHQTNQKAARMLAEGAGKQGLRDARLTDRKQGDPNHRVPFHIDNWHEGTGHFRRIAQDTIDDDHDYADSLGRMH